MEENQPYQEPDDLYVNENGTNLKDAEVLIDGNRGIYMTSQFMVGYEDCIISELSEEDREILRDPDHEDHFEVWDEVKEAIRLQFPGNPRVYRLEEDGDLFAVPVEEEVEIPSGI